MTDTHAHLYDGQFDDDREDVIGRAIAQGVHRMLLPNINGQTVQPMFDLCRKYPRNCFPMIGLHPTDVGPGFRQQLDSLVKYLDRDDVIGIGEIGVDLYWDTQYKDQQLEAFRIQVGWAKQRNLPISVHCRKSFDEIMSVLRSEQDGSLTGVFHCFPGNIRQAEEVIRLGFAIGIGGVVTYKNAKMADVVKNIDIHHILTETDAPYLPPDPFRGKRNESAYIQYIVRKIAGLKGLSDKEVSDITDSNTRRVFHKLP